MTGFGTDRRAQPALVARWISAERSVAFQLMWGWWAGSSVVVVAMGVLLLGCDSSEGEQPRTLPQRFDPIGTVAAPARPFATGALPNGWQMRARVLGGGSALFASAEQVLYMPAESTPSSGPALVAGYVTDEEWGPDSCDPPRDRPDRSASSVDGIVRWGRGLTAMVVTGPSYITTNGAYVFGRDVDDADLRRAAGSVRWPEPSTTDRPLDNSQPPTLELPPGFTMRATGDLAAHGQPWPVRVQLSAGPDRWIWIGQEEGNAAGVFLADFWRSVTKGQRCGGPPTVERTLIREHTVIRLYGPDTPDVRAAMTFVERGLHRVSRRRFASSGFPGA